MESKANGILRFIPNTITLLNVLMGCMAIVMAFQGNVIIASVFIFMGGVFDFFDGLAARMLKAYSEIGKQLDSLADMVTFGVAPASIMFQLMKLAYLQSNPIAALEVDNMAELVIPSFAFIIALFAALRLAKFNIDTRQTDSFIGVPTPATAFFVASLPFVLTSFPSLSSLLINVYALGAISLALALLNVSEIHMMSFKFKNLNFGENFSRYLLVLFALVLLALLKLAAYPFIFLIYLTISIAEQVFKKKATV